MKKLFIKEPTRGAYENSSEGRNDFITNTLYSG